VLKHSIYWKRAVPLNTLKRYLLYASRKQTFFNLEMNTKDLVLALALFLPWHYSLITQTMRQLSYTLMPNIHIIHATKHVNQTKNRDLAVLQSQ
jgi:hypothetical protein